MTPTLLSRRNYLHHGDFLDRSRALLGSLPAGPAFTKLEACRANREGPFADEVLRAYGPLRSRRILRADLAADIEASFAARDWFRGLGTRGFSYRLISDFEFARELRPEIDLRVGLFFGDDLFYPPRLRRFLQRHADPHMEDGTLKCLGFALGQRAGSAWIVSVLQSDLTFNRPSYVRDHIRGWQRVLMAEILAQAKRAGVAKLLLAAASDQVRCSDPAFKIVTAVPESWRLIYDQTAGFFGMTPQQGGPSFDIQVLDRLGPVVTDRFYEKAIA
ncbi:MAG TPA: hypothetical protein VHA07_13010 [Devosia sp.]|nr:hypothetical protein [Devosia sp.]